jgi:hypothetical protein
MKMTGARYRARPLLRHAAAGLCLLVPLLMGGCPEYRDDLVGVFETATRDVLLGTEDEWTIANTVRGAVVDATIDLVFDQFRSDQD